MDYYRRTVKECNNVKRVMYVCAHRLTNLEEQIKNELWYKK